MQADTMNNRMQHDWNGQRSHAEYTQAAHDPHVHDAFIYQAADASNNPAASAQSNHAAALAVEGSKTVLLDTVTAYSLEEVVERDYSGLLASAGILLNLAAVFLVGVMAFGWRENFMIAVVLLMTFAVASLSELGSPARCRYQKFTLYQNGATPATLTCADQAHRDAVLALLVDHGIERL